MMHPRWHRVGRQGWHVPVLLGIVIALVGLVVPLGVMALVGALSGLRLAVGAGLFVLSCGLLVVGCSLVARRGVWTADEGVRIQWLLTHETIPWSEVAIVGVAPMRHSLGERLWCATIEVEAGGRQIALPATSDLAARLLRSSRPQRVRHELSRERRHQLARSLPRRRPTTPTPRDGGVHVYALDLRDPEPGVVVGRGTEGKSEKHDADVSNGMARRVVTIDLRDPRTGEVIDLRAPLQPGPGESRRSVPPSKL